MQRWNNIIIIIPLIINFILHYLGYKGEPFLWDEKERIHLQSQLDALFFILYGIEREDVDYIMETFPIIKKQDKEKYGKYLRKHLILEYYNAYKSGYMETKVRE